MKKIKLLIWVAVGLFTTSTFSQKSQDEIFNQEVKRIKDKIVEITNKEKELLKESVDSINTLLENGTISFEKCFIINFFHSSNNFWKYLYSTSYI